MVSFFGTMFEKLEKTTRKKESRGLLSFGMKHTAVPTQPLRTVGKSNYRVLVIFSPTTTVFQRLLPLGFYPRKKHRDSGSSRTGAFITVDIYILAELHSTGAKSTEARTIFSLEFFVYPKIPQFTIQKESRETALFEAGNLYTQRRKNIIEIVIFEEQIIKKPFFFFADFQR